MKEIKTTDLYDETNFVNNVYQSLYDKSYLWTREDLFDET